MTGCIPPCYRDILWFFLKFKVQCLFKREKLNPAKMNGNQSATVADIAGSANSRISSSNASHYWEQSSCAVAITNASQFVSISGLFAFPFGELF